MSSKIRCTVCGKSISPTATIGIRHYKNLHSQYPEHCYKQFGKTWDAVTDRILLILSQQNDAVRDATNRALKAEMAFKEENAIRNTLATKLNGIIMILEHKS